MKQFEYDEMTERETRIETAFEFKNQTFYDFLRALNALGQEGWEWVGTRGKHYILKREIPTEEDE